MHLRKVPSKILDKFSHVPLSKAYDQDTEVEIDILIGLDHYWKFVTADIVRSEEDDSIVAQRTLFGWMLSGSYVSDSFNKSLSNALCCVQSIRDSDLERIWDSDVHTDSVDNVLQEFENNLVFKDGRYEAALPWKSSISPSERVFDSYGMAKAKLVSLDKRLSKNVSLKSTYDGILSDLEASNIVEEVPSSEFISSHPTYYMSHFPVFNENSSSTPVRPVFHGSARDRNGLSINDCVETGPNLLPDLVSILIRFRKWVYAITADIRKAFYQIRLRIEDRDVHRFLWLVDGKIRVMRFTRVPFGNRASPFMLNATVKFHLKQFDPNSAAVQALSNDLYVDDLITGADGDSESTDLIVEAKDIMGQGNFLLTKWDSSSLDVLDKAVSSSDVCRHNSEGKVLGLRWNAENDSFSFRSFSLESNIVIFHS